MRFTVQRPGKALVAAALLGFVLGWEVIAESSWTGVIHRLVVVFALALDRHSSPSTSPARHRSRRRLQQRGRRVTVRRREMRESRRERVAAAGGAAVAVLLIAGFATQSVAVGNVEEESGAEVIR